MKINKILALSLAGAVLAATPISSVYAAASLGGLKSSASELSSTASLLAQKNAAGSSSSGFFSKFKSFFTRKK